MQTPATLYTHTHTDAFNVENDDRKSVRVHADTLRELSIYKIYVYIHVKVYHPVAQTRVTFIRSIREKKKGGKRKKNGI